METGHILLRMIFPQNAGEIYFWSNRMAWEEDSVVVGKMGLRYFPIGWSEVDTPWCFSHAEVKFSEQSNLR